MKIGFIGLGIMGRPMAKNLIRAGHELVVYDVNPANVKELVDFGATEAHSSREVAEACRLVITMVPNSPHVKAAVMAALLLLLYSDKHIDVNIRKQHA